MRLSCISAVDRKAPLAARPAPTLSKSSFANGRFPYQGFVRQSVLLPQNGSHPQFLSKLGENKNRMPEGTSYFCGAVDRN